MTSLLLLALLAAPHHRKAVKAIDRLGDGFLTCPGWDFYEIDSGGYCKEPPPMPTGVIGDPPCSVGSAGGGGGNDGWFYSFESLPCPYRTHWLKSKNGKTISITEAEYDAAMKP